MDDENENGNEIKLSNTQQIVQHIINKEPSKLAEPVGKEIAAHVVAHIEDKKMKIGADLFGN